MPLPVSSALAGHATTRVRGAVSASSIAAAVSRHTRICAIDRSNPSATWPSTWTDTTTAATCRRGSRNLGGWNRHRCTSPSATDGSGWPSSRSPTITVGTVTSPERPREYDDDRRYRQGCAGTLSSRGG